MIWRKTEDFDPPIEIEEYEYGESGQLVLCIDAFGDGTIDMDDYVNFCTGWYFKPSNKSGYFTTEHHARIPKKKVLYWAEIIDPLDQYTELK